MKKLQGLRRARIEYRIALISAVIIFVVGVLNFLFVLLPIYGMFGDDFPENTQSKITKLETSESIANVVRGVTYMGICIATGASVLGVYKDVTNKPKK